MKATFGLVLLLAACDRHAASMGTAASAVPQRAPAPVKSGLTPFPADPADQSPLDLGPVADSASASDRQERLVELLRGQIPAEKLLLAPTDPGRAFDRDQFGNLTTSVEVGEKPLGRRGSASVGQHRLLSGDLGGRPLERVLSAMRAGFRHCYNRALQVDPKLEGALVLRIGVDGSGAMSKVSVVSAPPRSVELKRCVVARVRASQLAPVPGPIEFDVPITFAVEGG